MFFIIFKSAGRTMAKLCAGERDAAIKELRREFREVQVLALMSLGDNGRDPIGQNYAAMTTLLGLDKLTGNSVKTMFEALVVGGYLAAITPDPTAATDNPPETETVHILFNDVPLCQFTKNVPGAWPRGHVFVHYNLRNCTTKSNCALCVQNAKTLDTHTY
jgi:hypothetical protein